MECQVKEIGEALAKDESYSDNVRFTMTWNCLMMVVFLLFHFALFSRTEDLDTWYKVGKGFPIMLIAEIVFALINFILIGTSVCAGESYGSAAIISSVAILIINGATLVLGILYFLAKTKTDDPAAVEQ